jgi:hypothetical protein
MASRMRVVVAKSPRVIHIGGIIIFLIQANGQRKNNKQGKIIDFNVITFGHYGHKIFSGYFDRFDHILRTVMFSCL